MKKSGKISTLQLSLIVITAVGLKNHVTILPHLLPSAKRDGWISVLLALGLILIWCLLLFYIHKATGQTNIFVWVETNIGKASGKVLSIATSIFFASLAAVSLKEMIMWTKVSYLPITPPIFEIILFTGLCFFLASTNIQTIVITNTFVLTAVIVFGIFVAFANIQFKDFSLLKPIMENGWSPVVSGMIYPLSGLIELIVILFMQQKVHGQLKFKVFTLNAIILTWLILGPLIGSITEFGPLEASRQKYPAFEQWGLVTLGRFIEHLDFLSIYQWLTGAFIRVSFFLFLSLEVLSIKKKRSKTILLLAYSILLIVANTYSFSDVILYHIIGAFVMPITFWFFLAVSILLSIFVFSSNRRKRRPPSDVQENQKATVQAEK
ncbi:MULTISPECIES: endospore germination permease [unclassified Bacillus (in: firmicutes)]|uniref:GerAB/ArcD/ProY family transporter n=1 Tax=unclassified Bacillus (in: firmicutes) TaxID=185979 RepID=UPI001BEC9ED0|nr:MULTISPECIES: endospore germination permease [unclassified Bacillus (in: firmicutes)]MBT2614509.1 endospore germination permease [Bacillus sp. ISL-78]MBT2632193.1 endospore germination permease [Bacillus sp. ISL-101]MBT2715489.1 endospore germination permease [Bacillus sp. ISL-57]